MAQPVSHLSAETVAQIRQVVRSEIGRFQFQRDPKRPVRLQDAAADAVQSELLVAEFVAAGSVSVSDTVSVSVDIDWTAKDDSDNSGVEVTAANPEQFTLQVAADWVAIFTCQVRFWARYDVSGGANYDNRFAHIDVLFSASGAPTIQFPTMPLTVQCQNHSDAQQRADTTFSWVQLWIGASAGDTVTTTATRTLGSLPSVSIQNASMTFIRF